MQIVHTNNDRVGPSAVTVGKFDGVHMGHQALLQATRDEAEARNLPAGVITFDRHPLEVLRPDSAPPYLTPLPEKLDLLAAAGMDFCVLLRLEDGVLSWPAQRFVEKTLVECAQARYVLAGPDFQYGLRRTGTLDTLREDGKRFGFEVDRMDPVLVQGRHISSYSVREALSNGDLPLAEAMLGRPYSVSGTVAHGRQLGRTLGYPTANLAFPTRVALPANGIYAVLTESEGISRPAVASLGVRPTVETSPAPVLLEVHVLDWSGDLYDKPLKVTFIRRLREEVRFDSLDALKSQIARDANEAREILREHTVGSIQHTGGHP